MKYSRLVICAIVVMSCRYGFSQTIEKKSYGNQKGHEKLEIRGAIPGLQEGETVFLSVWDVSKNQPIRIDSVSVKNKEFHFHYVVEEGPRLFWIAFSKHSHIIAVPLDNNEKVYITSDFNLGDIKDQSAFKYLRIEGSETAKQHLYLSYGIHYSWYYSRLLIESMIKKYKDSTLTKEKLAFLSGMLSARKLMDKTIGDILVTQPIKEVTPTFFDNIPLQFQRDSLFVKVYNKLDERTKNSYYGKLMKDQVALCIGQPAPDFTFTSIEGKQMSLSAISEKNKLTILSFWSNGSVDRQRINGELAGAYKKYHQKGLEVVSVSLDANPVKWKRIIEEDRIPGIKTCDFMEEESPIAKLYKANTRDTVNILVDGKGRIIGWDVDGVMLTLQLIELFGE